MKFNLTGVQAKQISGQPLSFNLKEALGNAIYNHTAEIRFVKVAQDINVGVDVDLPESDLRYFIEVVRADNCLMPIAVKVAIMQALEEAINNAPVEDAKTIDE